MVKVKICGITNVSDAMMAVKAGADALGFNFWPGSVRFVEPEEAAAICMALPPFVATVGVFVDAPVEMVRHIAETCRLDYVQLHGHETPAKVARLSDLRILKAVRMRDERDLRELDKYRVDAFVLDTFAEDRPGGTGRTFDWELARQAASQCKVILAGGLTPENVAEAVRTARPYGVDVASGVEEEPGKKSARLVNAFIRAAKGVEL